MSTGEVTDISNDLSAFIFVVNQFKSNTVAREPLVSSALNLNRQRHVTSLKLIRPSSCIYHEMSSCSLAVAFLVQHIFMADRIKSVGSKCGIGHSQRWQKGLIFVRGVNGRVFILLRQRIRFRYRRNS